jgi:ABC-2 type transport system permease protein
VRKSLFSYTASPGFFWTLALGWMMGPLVYLFVWAAAAGQGDVGGLGRDDFVLYYLCLIVVNQVTYPVSNWTVGDVIRYGSFSTWLLRPVPAVYEAVATDLATKTVCLPFVLAVTVALGLVLRPATALSGPTILAFLAALVLAQALRFALGYVLALLALWSSRADALLRLNDTFLFLLGGQVAPNALLPAALAGLSRALPFRYMVGFPVEVLLGQLSPAQVTSGFAIQLGWLLMVVFVHHLVWRAGLRRYTAVGG